MNKCLFSILVLASLVLFLSYSVTVLKNQLVEIEQKMIVEKYSGGCRFYPKNDDMENWIYYGDVIDLLTTGGALVCKDKVAPLP